MTVSIEVNTRSAAELVYEIEKNQRLARVTEIHNNFIWQLERLLNKYNDMLEDGYPNECVAELVNKVREIVVSMYMSAKATDCQSQLKKNRSF